MVAFSGPSDDSRLLPCPFCGGRAGMHDIGNGHTKSRATEIGCAECGFRRKVGAIHHSLDWTREHAILRWNTRATDARIAELEARAKKAEAALANEAELHASDRRLLELATAELARLRAAGTFNEGIEAAASYLDGQVAGIDGLEHTSAGAMRRVFRVFAAAIRNLRRPEGGA